jgi:hypothetical protein
MAAATFLLHRQHFRDVMAALSIPTPISRLLWAGIPLLKRNSRQLERLGYLLFAAACTLWSAHLFFASLRFQLFLSESHQGFMSRTQPWSAPLDDVFIHFDFARAAARGYPFQWSEGNGYSSGGTSLLYPFVLAIGYRAGFEHEDLMLWAGMVAVSSVLIGLLNARALVQELPRWCSWLLPPALLSTGVLNWTLWSGMEVAFFFAVWSGAAVAFVRLVHARPSDGLAVPALWLGLLGAVLTATRPEAAVTVACLSLVGVAAHVRRARLASLFWVLLLTALPGALVVIGHALANRWYTGDYAAAGALAKLEINHPYLSRQQIVDAWKFHFGYQILRLTNYHLSAAGDGAGWAAWALGVVALLDRRTRTISVLLWLSVLSFIAVVAFNGQVRWQNERYTMPAVAWLLLNAGIGLGVGLCSLSQALRRLRARPRNARAFFRPVPGALALALGLFFWNGQAKARAGQAWFFGRASRNIFDQHIHVARQLRHTNPAPERVLVGDAGAIPYVSDLPALDIIGLGGYHDLPFARAARHGVAAALELVERMSPRERPDVMAIYPSWWGDLPLWFGKELWATPVRGNVICGGSEKVVYQADWSPFAGSELPTTQRRESVVAELDVGDLASERARHTEIHGAPGFVSMKLLPYPGKPKRDLWDAGRLLPAGSSLSFTSHPPRVHDAMHWILRVAPPHDVDLSVWVNGTKAADLHIPGKDDWQEPFVEIPATLVDPEMHFRIRVEQGELVLFHLWGALRR